ncbi:biotin transporter BioY [bacterium]|nr:biotin transporter BioY [bacterium]
MTTAPAVISARVLPMTRATTSALIVGFALLTAAAAQIQIPLWFTPVPITGQTFAVLLAGAALGWRAGAASQALYLGLGAIGLPFFAGGEGGWSVVTGATGGYLIGFVLAAALVGTLAERRHDRSVLTAIPTFLAGSALIYLAGVTVLAARLDVGAIEAMELGMVPFIMGDLIKIGLAGLALPAAWRLVGER